MIKRISLFLAIFLFCFIYSTDAQRLKAFSSDPSLTQEEMRVLAASVPKERQKEAEAELEKFDAFWTSSQMTEEFQNSFIEISNLMLRKNMRFFPHFSAFFKACRTTTVFCPSPLAFAVRM